MFQDIENLKVTMPINFLRTKCLQNEQEVSKENLKVK